MCREQATLLPVGKAYTRWPVLTEAAYRPRRYSIERAKLFQAVRDGIYVLLPLGAQDMVDIEAVFQTYQDQKVDLADACLVDLGKREKIRRVFTLTAATSVSTAWPMDGPFSCPPIRPTPYLIASLARCYSETQRFPNRSGPTPQRHVAVDVWPPDGTG